jgi:hypothetical protein
VGARWGSGTGGYLKVRKASLCRVQLISERKGNRSTLQETNVSEILLVRHSDSSALTSKGESGSPEDDLLLARLFPHGSPLEIEGLTRVVVSRGIGADTTGRCPSGSSCI